MKLVRGYTLLSKKELDEVIQHAEKRGVVKGSEESMQRIKALEKGLENKTEKLEARIDKLNRQLEISNSKVEVLEEERDETREVVKQKIKNEDVAKLLGSKEHALNKREKYLDSLELNITKNN